MRTAVGDTGEVGDQPRVVAFVGLRLSGVARRKDAGRAAQGGDAEPGIVGQGRQAGEPGGMARLGYGYVVRCTGCEKDADGRVTTVFCEYLAETRSGTPGADSVKVKGNLHWVSAAHGCAAEVRLYDRLFAHAYPGARREGDAEGLERNYLDDINPQSKAVIRAVLEPALREVAAESRFQFERHGYFVADRVDSKAGAPVFNRTVTLHDSWAKTAK